MQQQLITTITRREYKIACHILNSLNLSKENRKYLLANNEQILGDQSGKYGLFNKFKEAQAEAFESVIGRPMGSRLSDSLDEMMDRVFDALIEARLLSSLLRKKLAKNFRGNE